MLFLVSLSLPSIQEEITLLCTLKTETIICSHFFFLFFIDLCSVILDSYMFLLPKCKALMQKKYIYIHMRSLNLYTIYEYFEILIIISRFKA